MIYGSIKRGEPQEFGGDSSFVAEKQLFEKLVS
jgi:hypothetical protein